MRLLPHDQDTGGFFVALLRKLAPMRLIDQYGADGAPVLPQDVIDKDTEPELTAIAQVKDAEA
jgi:hypothetical protein